ncbi:toll/interleukin-1 receptor domain-containing protein [Actinoplanes sp. L3-i22]|uniref:toll/interleukin-1 receptor domain-containing protein n=1 Tax=Actinoplanes sp. L3-i22 TaxID=2836373 RepID=UPI001C79333B|nr:toll/interleukin-1 receptor domain-containing protein [Actinoplanes sp. L3-i22]BCY07099.1 hypothetical protein L3i22_021870 [Actinoplanes sp. L3-i22]
MGAAKIDFFVSYNANDKTWAEWISSTLEGAGYSTIIQAWDFRPGNNFVVAMHQALIKSKKVIPVLSPHYLKAKFTHAEWAAAFADDPLGVRRIVIPAMIEECRLSGLLSPIVHIKLYDMTEDDARTALLVGVQEGPVRPKSPPPFPGGPPSSI